MIRFFSKQRTNRRRWSIPCTMPRDTPQRRRLDSREIKQMVRNLPTVRSERETEVPGKFQLWSVPFSECFSKRQTLNPHQKMLYLQQSNWFSPQNMAAFFHHFSSGNQFELSSSQFELIESAEKLFLLHLISFCPTRLPTWDNKEAIFQHFAGKTANWRRYNRSTC